MKEKSYNDNRNFLDMKGKDVRSIRRDLGMLFQGNALFDSLTVEENVAFPLVMFSKMSKGRKVGKSQLLSQKGKSGKLKCKVPFGD